MSSKKVQLGKAIVGKMVALNGAPSEVDQIRSFEPPPQQESEPSFPQSVEPPREEMVDRVIELSRAQRSLLVKIQRYHSLFGEHIDFVKKDRSELVTMSEDELRDYIEDLKLANSNADVSSFNKLAFQLALGVSESAISNFTNFKVRGLAACASPYQNPQTGALIEEISVDETDFSVGLPPYQRLGLLCSSIAYNLHLVNSRLENEQRSSSPPHQSDFVDGGKAVDQNLVKNYEAL